MNPSAAEPISRRRLLAALAGSSPFLIARRKRAAEAAKRIDRSALTAVAEAVLPPSIGAAGIAAVVEGFDRWLAGYRGGAELLHGYGASEIRYAPPSPAPRFEADLVALDRAARDRRGRGLGQLAVEERRGLIEKALGSTTDAIVPPVGRATHVVIALIAWWAESPAGFDAGYQARIGRFQCRSLATSGKRPAVVAGDA
jgi:hypothetical protein